MNIPTKIIVWLKYDEIKKVWFPNRAVREDEINFLHGKTISDLDKFYVYELTDICKDLDAKDN
jgi:hypothetical protein